MLGTGPRPVLLPTAVPNRVTPWRSPCYTTSSRYSAPAAAARGERLAIGCMMQMDRDQMSRAKPGARSIPALDFISHSPEQTRRVGRRLGQHAQPGDLFLLSGGFGAGKTVLTQGLAAGLGVPGEVNSPSFTLVNEYDGHDSTGRPIRLCHLDLYRLGDPAAVASLGLDDYLDAPDSLCVIEWSEHLPDDAREHLSIAIGMVSETKRRLTFTPRGARYTALLDALKVEAFGVEH